MIGMVAGKKDLNELIKEFNGKYKKISRQNICDIMLQISEAYNHLQKN